MAEGSLDIKSEMDPEMDPEMEPELQPKVEPKDEHSLFVVDENNSTSMAIQTRLSRPLWKIRQDTILQQVDVEEQSLHIALSELRELKSRLLKYTKAIPSAINRIERIGKSFCLLAQIFEQSLTRIRCLFVAEEKLQNYCWCCGSNWHGQVHRLERRPWLRELLPTDNGHACTSAIIEVLWNPSKDPASLFQAKIIFLQPGDWQIEMEQLYQDMEALARKEAGEDSGDLELKTRVEAVMEKVRAVFPFIDNTQDLKRTTLAKLMSHRNVKNLGKELVFTGRDQKKFSSQIRQFLVSSVRGENLLHGRWSRLLKFLSSLTS